MVVSPFKSKKDLKKYHPISRDLFREAEHSQIAMGVCSPTIEESWHLIVALSQLGKQSKDKITFQMDIYAQD